MITASIVSHGHGKMVEEIAGQLANSDLITKIIVTLNIPENFELNNQKIILEKNTNLLYSTFFLSHFKINKLSP